MASKSEKRKNKKGNKRNVKEGGEEKSSRGGGKMEVQIQTLEDLVGDDGVNEARELVESTDANILKLAFKYVRRTERAAGPQGLGSRIDALLAEMDDKEATEIRNKLMEAKAAKAAA